MLGLAVFIASFATMAFELGGARALAPYLGTTIEVWTGAIAAVLGGLALGYWIGGIIADRHPRRTILAGSLFLAGVAVAFATLLHDVVPDALGGSGLPLPLIALVTGAVLFAPAAAFLGAASPAAAKLAITDLRGSARTVGSLSAWAALGSIAGTVMTGMVLIAYVGTGLILAGTALLLIASSFLIERRWLWWLRLGVGIGTVLLAWHGTALGFPGVVADLDTRYSRVRIGEAQTVASGTLRYVQTDPYGYQCGALVDEDGTVRVGPVFDYLQFFEVGELLRPDADRLLVIGGCNLSYPRHLLTRFPDAEVEVLEIDPGMTVIARDWFGYVPDPRLAVRHGDARQFLNDGTGTFDIAYGDAFTAGGSVPHQLTTREAMQGLNRLLGKDGVLVLNTFGAVTGPAADFTRAEVATLREVFADVRVFVLGASADDVAQNVMILASDAPIPQIHRGREVPLSAFAGGSVLTDDYAPVEALTASLREQIIHNSR